MNRRELISSLALVMGGTILGAEIFTGCSPKPKKPGKELVFNNNDIALFNEIAETILPATNTPGAKAAKVGEFMALYVKDCYTIEQQTIFINGITQLQDACKKINGKSFENSTQEQKNNLLVALDKEQKTYHASKKETDPYHYFRMIKEMTLMGFFTSEVGATKALRYVAVPGKYQGCIDYKKGDKAWAT